MTGFFSKIFGSKKQVTAGDIEGLIDSTLSGLLEKAQLDLSYELSLGQDDKGEAQVLIEMTGNDEEMLKDREGQMIEALQLFLKRVVQHHLPEDRTNVVIDCNGYREESTQALVELAEKLKNIALDKGKSVYFRALPPKDRKVIHQYLANDERVKSRSVGEGLYKKIKIYPIKSASQEERNYNN